MGFRLVSLVLREAHLSHDRRRDMLVTLTLPSHSDSLPQSAYQTANINLAIGPASFSTLGMSARKIVLYSPNLSWRLDGWKKKEHPGLF